MNTPANDNGLRFLSVCSGIEAASQAWNPIGWSAVAFSEIEKFPSAVLAYHHPDVPNLGDFTKIDVTTLGRVDILCGGTPCQAFSVAGQRNSLADARGNLTLSFVRLAHELAGITGSEADRDVRSGERQSDRGGNGLRNVVWENVPGVLNTKDNAFGCFLGALVGADDALPAPTGNKWPVAGMVSGPKGRAAWRTLDAQYFGLAQRRRRVILVADFGNGADPAAVLFEFESLLGNTPPSREAGKDVAPTISARTKGGGGLGTDFDLDGGLVEIAAEQTFAIQERAVSENLENGPQGKGYQPDISYTLEARNKVQAVAWSIMPQNSGKDYKERQVDVAQPLMAAGPVGGNQGGDFIQQPVAYAPQIARCVATREGSSQDYETTTMVAVEVSDAVCVTSPVTHTLKAEGADASEDGTGRGTPIVVHGTQDPCVSEIAHSLQQNAGQENVVCFSSKDYGGDATENLSPTLRASGHTDSHANASARPAVAYSVALRGREGGATAEMGGEQAGTLRASGGGGDKAHVLAPVVHVAEVAPTLGKESFSPMKSSSGQMEDFSIATTSAVRRLTPRECERLMGFPDDYTRIPTWKGWRAMDATETPESCAAEGLEVRQNKKTGKWSVQDVDGPRYKALGNSWAVPKFRWLGERIAKHMPINKAGA